MGGLSDISDFLFGPAKAPTVNTSSNTTTNVPSWLSDYTQGLLARANTVASEPYQTYGGPRIAGFDPAQVKAQGMAESNVGNWKPAISQAQGAYGAVAGGPGALSKAQPYFDVGAGSYTDAVQKYMDPYVQNVIDRSTQLANRNFTEKLLPSINNNFIKAGAYGSAAQQRATGNALRDVTAEVQDQAKSYLSDAYKSGADIYGNEATRNIQAGQTAGQLYGQDMSNQLQAGAGLGALGQYMQQLGLGDVTALNAAGADRQALEQRNLDTAYGDFQAQRDYPKNQLSWLQGISQGIPDMGKTEVKSGTQPADSVGPTGIQQIGSVASTIGGLANLWGRLTGSNKTGVVQEVPITHFPKYDESGYGSARGGLARLAHGGLINHIPGPIGGFDRYRRGGLAMYAKGGLVRKPKVGALTVMRRLNYGR